MAERANLLTREELLSSFGQRLIIHGKHSNELIWVKSENRVDVEAIEDPEDFFILREKITKNAFLEATKFFKPCNN